MDGSVICAEDVDPLVFSFRVKFFPADPFRLAGNAKIMLYQQLKRDLIHGRLYCSAGEAAALGSLIVQGLFQIKNGSRLRCLPIIASDLLGN